MDMSSNRIAHAHDAFVRTAMSDPRIDREFFEVHLSEDIRKLVNLTFAEICLLLRKTA